MTVEVTQADREAADKIGTLMHCYYEFGYKTNEHAAFQAMARHRIEATRASDARNAELEAKVARLEEALRAALDFIEATESDWEMTLNSGDLARAALGDK